VEAGLQDGRHQTLNLPPDFRDLPGAPPPGTELCKAAIAPGAAEVVTFGSGAQLFEMFVLRAPENVAGGPADADGLVAFVNDCPHARSPLDWKPGEFLDLDKRYIHCTTHGAKFRIKDGMCVDGPCLGQPLTPVPIVVRGGTVFVAGT